MIDVGAINPQDMWFKHLLADVVSRYSDVDTSELLDEEEMELLPEQEIIPGAEVQPTIQEQEEPTAPEQEDLIQQVQQAVPPRE